ncbi:MAG: 2OG-Fe dioxygenase family protein, partial [Pirellulales bacterium]|nr:2OG-Fe dioxygenase family protein [Pirellulales bacterium]
TLSKGSIERKFRDARSDAHHAEDAILSICQTLNMPGPTLVPVAQILRTARFVHFGFEQSSTNILCKMYLEMEPAAKRTAEQGVVSVPLYTGFKWDILDDTQCYRTDYVWYPELSVRDILRRLDHIYASSRDAETFNIAQQVLEMAASRMPPGSLRYLEVKEDGNLRRSFDLNVYDAVLSLATMEELLARLSRHFDIPRHPFESFYCQIRPEVLGHVASGVHRDGRDFFTFYYGVEERHG